MVATVTADGFVRVDDEELATRYRAIADAVRDRNAVQPSEGADAMSMPFYVAPEQVMKDRADYARKGIARARPLVASRFAEGIAMVAESSSPTLHKISEIYDRIAFAGAGRYNEYDQLRVAGVRAADLKGYQYSRDDVDARSLANQYAQILGQIFTHEMKPMEVEILVAEVGRRPPTATRCSTSTTTARWSTSATRACSAATSTTISTRLAEAAGSTPTRRPRPRLRACGPPSVPSPAPTARARRRPRGGAARARPVATVLQACSPTTSVAALLPAGDADRDAGPAS